MKSVSAKRLYAYWQALRNDRPAPERRDLEPSSIKGLLSDIFILEHEAAEQFSFRLAGSALCSAYCRELKGRSFRKLWPEIDLEALDTTLLAIREEAAATVIGYDAINSRGHVLGYEMLLLPLRYGGADFPRILGISTPVDQPYWLGVHPIMEHQITSMRLIWPDETPAFMRTGSVIAHPAQFEAETAYRGNVVPLAQHGRTFNDFGMRMRAEGSLGRPPESVRDKRAAFRVIKGGMDH
ncbi:MAG: PAS domain-containing protein [Pseudomonadota bacterium]